MPIFIGLNASDATPLRCAGAAPRGRKSICSDNVASVVVSRARVELARRAKNLGAWPNFFLHRSQLRLFIVFATHSHVPMAHRGYATT
jgi:hypothetical protein